MQARPDLRGCTGVAWDVTDFGAGGILLNSWHGRNSWSLFHLGCSVAGVGCRHGAGGGDAGCAAKKQWLDRACSVAVVPLGTVSAALTLHSWRCLCMQRYVEPLLVHTR